MPERIGSEITLSFRHSIYGSQVEEQFHITRSGFELTRLRYSEARLAEFYGHEAARLDNGWWVVEGVSRSIPLLYLRLAPDSLFNLSLSSGAVSLSGLAQPGSLVRVGISPCKGAHRGR